MILVLDESRSFIPGDEVSAALFRRGEGTIISLKRINAMLSNNSCQNRIAARLHLRLPGHPVRDASCTTAICGCERCLVELADRLRRATRQEDGEPGCASNPQVPAHGTGQIWQGAYTLAQTGT